MAKKWYSVREAAAYFNIKPATMYSLAARGRLGEGAVLRLGRQVRINPEKVEAAALGKK
jgi:excisionase family DNA binding protein